MLETHHLMFSLPHNQLANHVAEAKNGLVAVGEQVPSSAGCERGGAQTVTVKLEPNGENAPTLHETGPHNGVYQSQLWTSGLERSGDAAEQNLFLLLPDVKYPLNGQPGYTSPVKTLPFLEHKDNDGMMGKNLYSLMGVQPRSSDVTLASEWQDKHVAQEAEAREPVAGSDRTHEAAAFEFNAAATGDGGSGQDASRQNIFVCSTCGLSFYSFSLFQRHQCEGVTE